MRRTRLAAQLAECEVQRRSTEWRSMYSTCSTLQLGAAGLL